MARKKSPKGLSFRQKFFLIWLVPLVLFLMYMRDLAPAPTTRTEPPATIKEKSTPRTTQTLPSTVQPKVPAPVSSGNAEIVPPSPSIASEWSGSASTEMISSGVTLSGSTATGVVFVQPYRNETIGYEFDMPRGTYWQAFGAQDGANHAITLSKTPLSNDFSDAPIRLWFYKKGNPFAAEMPESFFQDPSSGKTFLPLSGGVAVLSAEDPNNPIVLRIIETIHTLP